MTTSFDSSQGSTIYERYCVHGVEGMDVSPKVAWTPTCARGRTCGDARDCAERGCDNVMDLEVGTAAGGRPQRRGGGYLFRPNRLREGAQVPKSSCGLPGVQLEGTG